jgi:hypothetical protein
MQVSIFTMFCSVFIQESLSFGSHFGLKQIQSLFAKAGDLPEVNRFSVNPNLLTGTLADLICRMFDISIDLSQSNQKNMKKIKSLLFLAAIVLLPTLNYAQAFDDNANLIYIGFGLPPGKVIAEDIINKESYTNYHLNNYGTGILRYEHGLNKYFGVGLNMEYSAASVNYKYDMVSTTTPRFTRTDKISVFGGYLRLNGHFPVGEKLDFYGGVGLGWTYKVDNSTDTNPNNVNFNNAAYIFGFDWQVSVGARFMVKKGFGMFAEVGYATTPCQIGVVFRF